VNIGQPKLALVLKAFFCSFRAYLTVYAIRRSAGVNSSSASEIQVCSNSQRSVGSRREGWEPDL